ncbi:hypothetical protein [Polyangium sp. 6x1]|uniref:hypothetical protein n=1 Tax=Polyangium sp. 6x1 TaxID=3042689 RepID=UPI002482B639|nr:hypothetical protein [Polyangium sp. 6x1]MDI1444292.1 hypothetical protein [Polyangium sp. 6x1]
MSGDYQLWSKDLPTRALPAAAAEADAGAEAEAEAEAEAGAEAEAEAEAEAASEIGLCTARWNQVDQEPARIDPSWRRFLVNLVPAPAEYEACG